VIGPARHSGGRSSLPVVIEAVVDVIAALRYFKIGEADVGVAYAGPVDIALVLGDVDPLNRQRMRTANTGMRIGIASRYGPAPFDLAPTTAMARAASRAD
jgi:hypothetical protein